MNEGLGELMCRRHFLADGKKEIGYFGIRRKFWDFYETEVCNYVRTAEKHYEKNAMAGL